jgi:Flp pilus assembly protein TadG
MIKPLLSPVLARFSRSQQGLAAIEFAFILPIMVVMYLGSVAVTMGVMTDRKVTLLARSLGDIVSQSTNLTAAQSTDVFKAGRAIMAPYDSSSTVLQMRVSSVKINTLGTKACVRWSRSPDPAFQRSVGADVTSIIPPDLLIANTYLVWPEVKYKYTPVVGASITNGPLDLSDQLFMRPRQSDEVTTDGQDTTKCPG